VVLVDQSPIGRTPRSNPVTYIKAFDIIRELFASTPDAEARLHGGHFSFNIPGGRCETCQGDGTVTVEMQFLADVELVCEECKGTRFKSAFSSPLSRAEYSRSAAIDGEGSDLVLLGRRRAWSPS
jgi:excinuclease ABC subunit A